MAISQPIDQRSPERSREPDKQRVCLSEADPRFRRDYAAAERRDSRMPPGLHLTPRDESLIQWCVADFGYSREEAIRRLVLHGGI